MQEQEKHLDQNTPSIRDILDRAQERERRGQSPTETTDGGVTAFVFEEERPARGLVFEEEGAPAPAKESPARPAQKQAEFDLSGGVSFARTASDGSHIAPTYGGYQVYVPVFTEASENYRMTGRTTPVTDDGEDSTPARRREAMRCPIVEVVDESADTPATAELPDEQTEPHEAVLVHVDTPAPAEARPAAPEAPAPEERTLEQEQEDIRRLLSKELPTEDPSATATVEELPAEDTFATATVEELPMEDVMTDVHHGGVFTEVTDTSRPVIPDPECDEPATPPPAGRELTLQTRKGAQHRPARKGREYDSYTGATKLKNRFLDTLMAQRVRLIALGVLTAALIALGLLPAVGIDLRLLLQMPDSKGLLALFDLILCGCAAALALPEVIGICKQLFAKRLMYTLLPLASTVGILLYDIYMIFAEITAYPLLGSLYALGLLATVLAAHLETVAMFTGFKLVSVKGVKGAIERTETRQLEAENIALDGAIDEYRSYTARMTHTSFIRDFFRRHRPVAMHADTVVFATGLLFGCSLLIGVIAALLGSGISDGVSTLCLVLLSATPIAAVLLRPLTYACAQRCCFLEDSAILGEEAMVEYADVDVISFDDTEVFGRGDVALKRVLIYGDKSRLGGALRQMASLFMAVGGPLQTLFADTLDRRPLPASRVRLEADGISGETEGADVHAGDAAYMRRLGYSIPDSADRDNVGTTRALYLAERGVVYAKFTFRYAFSEEFSQLLPTFKEQGIVPLIYTRDPNVTQELLLALTTGEDCMRVMHVCSLAEADEATPSASAGLVTLTDKTAAIRLILTAKTYVAYQRRMRYVMLGQTVAGLVLFGSLAFLPIPTALPWMLLWQGLWGALYAALGMRTFSLRRRRRELIEKEKELSHD